VLRQRIERLLEKLFVPTPGQMRDLRAVELLELVNGSDARQVLVALAGGLRSARLAQAAKGALDRLTKRMVTR
jgi:hypothetical protein